jgi:hypothetical protein
LLILFAASTLTSGCARRLVGPPIQVENVSKILVGQTTRSEVLKLYSETRDRADVLTIFLDRNGIVTEHSYSEGVATPDIYRQPRGRPSL